MLRIEKLSKSFGKKTLLQSISLQLKSGEVHGIVGENGAGKTTFFKCIAQLESHQGTVVFSDASQTPSIGFLETNPQFLSKMTGKEYLQLLCNARNINAVNFEDSNLFDLPLQQYASTYSTGMKKKLALTGILLQQNDIFILDEPFNGVDIQSNILIKEIIKKLQEKGKIILLSSHIFTTLQDTCDFLHYLKAGKIEKSVEKEKFPFIEELMKDAALHNKLQKFNIK